MWLMCGSIMSIEPDAEPAPTRSVLPFQLVGIRANSGAPPRSLCRFLRPLDIAAVAATSRDGQEITNGKLKEWARATYPVLHGEFLVVNARRTAALQLFNRIDEEWKASLERQNNCFWAAEYDPPQ